MMTEVTLARLRAHSNNVHRYRRLLATRLSELERAYVARRLDEEQARMQLLLKEVFPDRLSAATSGATKLDMDVLLHPADAFIDPMDVVEDCDLTTYEKRAILSSWAADVCAVKEVSGPGRSPHTESVSFDDVLDALRMLDADREPDADDGESLAAIPPRKNGGLRLPGL